MSAVGFEAFLNERSLCNQFHDRDGFQRAIMRFVGLVEHARRAADKGRGSLWRSERLTSAEAQKGIPLVKSLNALLSADVKNQFVDIVFNRACPRPWESDPLRHPANGHYQCTDDLPASFDRDVRDTSMAELAERRRLTPELLGCLLNVELSPLAGRAHVAVDAQGTIVQLDCLDGEASLGRWLEKFESVPRYGSDATYPPRDEQTCLADRLRFEPINRLNKERRVYKNITSGEFYAVDSKRVGANAELEVFDKFERHKGTADIQTGRLRPGTAVSGRWLTK